MTDGVARELEQAEARLAATRDGLQYAWQGWLTGANPSDQDDADDALADFEAAAIEVGRLRALAEAEHREWHHSEDGEQVPLAQCEDPACSTLAAREGAQRA